jgi:hypothetical protein
VENLEDKVLTIGNKQYWKRREFRSGTTYESEMFWVPYFELRKGKVVQVVDKVSPKFLKTVKLSKEFDLCLDLKHGCYFTWRELTEDTLEDFEKYGIKINEKEYYEPNKN